jgi:peptide/nickel transport system substrate-binding protein
MVHTNRRLWLAFAVLLLALAGCRDDAAEPDAGTALPEQVAATATPEIKIVERERVIVGVDSAFPPLADLDRTGSLIGIDIDIFGAVAEAAAIDFELVGTAWDTLFLDLIGGRFDAAIGGITADKVPTDLVDLTVPYLEIGQVAVALERNDELEDRGDLSDAIVGVEPLSWGEFATIGDEAVLALAVGNVRRYESAEELIEALFAGHVDAVVTHHTVIESYTRVNPGYLRLLLAPGEVAGGPSDPSAWLTSHAFRIAVPKGAAQLLATLNGAIRQVAANGELAQIVHAWGFSPEFAERPRFVQDPGSPSLIAGIEKVDDLTVRFVLNRPDPFFDYKMAVPSMAIHSPVNLESYGRTTRLTMQPVGTGPYRVESWEPGQPITLTANSDYWGPAPAFESVVITPVADPEARFDLLKSGAVQLVENLGREALEELEEDDDDNQIAVAYRVPVNVAYLGMNRDRAPFDDRTVRMAVATCIDQIELMETVYPSGTIAATQFVPPNTYGFTPGLLWHGQDPERSAALLGEAGLDDGLRLTLTMADESTDYLPTPVIIAEAIQAQLAACQITATLEIVDGDTFDERLAAGELPFYLTGWSADFPGPINLLNTHFVDNRQFGAPYPEIVTILREASESSDRTRRDELYRQTNELLKEKVIFVPLAHGAGNLGMSADLPGVVTNPLRRESLAALGPITGTKEITALVYAVASLPRSLDPTDEMDDATFAVTTQVFDTLIEYEPATAVLTAGLALEWSANEAFDVWEFKLRPGVRFQDGSLFNADAVVLNWERLWDRGHPFHVGRIGTFRYFRILFGGFRPPE